MVTAKALGEPAKIAVDSTKPIVKESKKTEKKPEEEFEIEEYEPLTLGVGKHAIFHNYVYQIVCNIILCICVLGFKSIYLATTGLQFGVILLTICIGIACIFQVFLISRVYIPTVEFCSHLYLDVLIPLDPVKPMYFESPISV